MTGWPATRGTPGWRPSASCSRGRSSATCRCSGSVTAARCSRRCSAPRSGRRRCRSWAGARSRPTILGWCRRGRGSSGTSSASARRRARPSSPAPPTRRRRSGSARTSACSSIPRRRWRSWSGGRCADEREDVPLAASPEQREAARARRSGCSTASCARRTILTHQFAVERLNWYGPPRADRVRLRLLLVRVQGGLPPPLRGVLEPGQDALLAGRRRRPGDRPPRGLLLLGHGGAAADRPAPQRRHLQPRPPQPRADRDARAGDGPVRHRQPPLPGAGADRARRGAGRDLPADRCSA